MRACGGVWVAHGSGNADREVGERIGLPSRDPLYTLRRVWLTEEEETGLLLRLRQRGAVAALPHRAHAADASAPTTGSSTARSTASSPTRSLEEMETAERPIVLVQDYHFALLPRLHQGGPAGRARSRIFWHIPWPNPEAFGICPWQTEIARRPAGRRPDRLPHPVPLQQLPGDGGPHARSAHRVGALHRAVRGAAHTWVRPFPISVATRAAGRAAADADLAATPAARELGVARSCLGIGVDRVDYTKGIPERLRGDRALLRALAGVPAAQFTSCRSASPSRTHIPALPATCSAKCASRMRTHQRGASATRAGSRSST